MLEQQLNETRTRKQMEISEIDGRLHEQYESKMQQNMNVSIFLKYSPLRTLLHVCIFL